MEYRNQNPSAMKEILTGVWYVGIGFLCFVGFIFIPEQFEQSVDEETTDIIGIGVFVVIVISAFIRILKNISQE